MTPDRLSQKLAFLFELDKLKGVLRVNRLRDGSREENTAEHSWSLAMMVLTLQEYAAEKIDVSRAVKMALVHDIVEIDAGDTYAYDQEHLNSKKERELEAAERIFGMLPPDDRHDYNVLWRDYEDELSAEARFVHALDRLHPFTQHLGNKGLVWKKRGMTKSLLMTRMGDVRRLCPKLWPFLEQSIAEAMAAGWLDQN